MEKQRNSKQRQLILDAVKRRCDHPTADQIYLEVREKDEKISRRTLVAIALILVCIPLMILFGIFFLNDSLCDSIAFTSFSDTMSAS